MATLLTIAVQTTLDKSLDRIEDRDSINLVYNLLHL